MGSKAAAAAQPLGGARRGGDLWRHRARGARPRRPCLGPPCIQFAWRQARLGRPRGLVGAAPPAPTNDQSRRPVDAPARRHCGVSHIEWIAAAFVLTNVALVALRSVWNYPFALIAVTLYAFVFFEAKLYSDMLLQGFFFALNLYGWAAWIGARDDAGVPVRWMTARARRGWAVATIAAWAGWSFAMDRATDAVAPWIDGAVAMLSVTAQWLLARRHVESWFVWIVVDLIAVPLFASRGLYATSAVYVVLLGLSIDGLIQWRRAAATGRVAI